MSSRGAVRGDARSLAAQAAADPEARPRSRISRRLLAPPADPGATASVENARKRTRRRAQRGELSHGATGCGRARIFPGPLPPSQRRSVLCRATSSQRECRGRCACTNQQTWIRRVLAFGLGTCCRVTQPALIAFWSRAFLPCAFSSPHPIPHIVFPGARICLSALLTHHTRHELSLRVSGFAFGLWHRRAGGGRHAR
ncbi:hypothetical protein OH77DRAFT_752749 [Trametes cingulata]|nr:hypothetical protein OH77DRAFT_752749 [Trametes cingulata]